MNGEPELRTRQRAIYGLGYLGVSITTFAITTWLAAYYLSPKAGAGALIPPMAIFGKVIAGSVLFGIAMSAGRIVDALTDPLIGYMSDNCRSKWGRRRPFIIFGTPLLVILFLLAYHPPKPAFYGMTSELHRNVLLFAHPHTPPYGHASEGNFYFLLAVISVFYLFYTIVITPYLALLPEIARSTAERLKLASWQTVFNMSGLLITMVVGALLISFIGFQEMAYIFAAVILAAFLISGFKTRERHNVDVKPGTGFWNELKLTFKNKPFLIYLFSQVFIWFGFNLIVMTVAHIVESLMGLGTAAVALCMGLTLVMVIITIPFVLRMAKLYGKKKTYLVMVSVFVVGYAAIYILRSPLIGNYSLHLGLAIFLLLGIPASAFFVIPNTIMGEIIDHDEKLTGKRREAIYFSAQALINKFGLAFSSLFMGFIFQYGYKFEQPLGVRLLGPSAAVFVLIGLIIFSFYPLEDAKFLRKRGGDNPQ